VTETSPPRPVSATDGTGPTEATEAWHQLPAETVLDRLGSGVDGLTPEQAAQRLIEVGPNELARPDKPSRLILALVQVRDPMNLMLLAVLVVSIIIGQTSTAGVVGFLVLLNVAMGANQELKAQASVDALADLQVPQSTVVRAGAVLRVPADDLVPGDIVQLEAGDIVPADGRVLTSATLEAQEAALTGESAPVGKDAAPVDQPDVPLGDRSSMLFQNTSVTRGSARMVVTSTGMSTEVGRIARMLGEVTRTRSPLQRQLDELTRSLGLIAWGTLAVILVVGLVRGLTFSELMLLGIAMAVSAIPTGLPTFVQSMLATGAQQLARAKAIVRNLADVETLGSTGQINTDKTGTLTLNQMTARSLYLQGHWYEVDGEGYSWTGQVRGVAGAPPGDLDAVAYVSALANDASVNRTGEVVGDPTEAALVVLAEKLGVSVDETRRAYPRLATVPFDSTYKFMATAHMVPIGGSTQVALLVKGGPDVVLARCSSALAQDGEEVDLASVHGGITAANERLGSSGLRVLALAYRALPLDQADAVVADPMAAVTDLVFVGLVGIIDPLRPEAVEAVRIARGAGIDVRMITGDHLVTAQAIGSELGLGAGGITGHDFAAIEDEALLEQLPDLHVFGRVSPQDKLRLVQLMQSQGSVVAMTGDAVNDAAALKRGRDGERQRGLQAGREDDPHRRQLREPGPRRRAGPRHLLAHHRLHRLPAHPAVRPGHHVPAGDRPERQLRRGAAAAAGALPQLHPGRDPRHHHLGGRARSRADASATPGPGGPDLQPHDRAPLGRARGAARRPVAATGGARSGHAVHRAGERVGDHGLHAYWSTLPPDDRPRLYLYGLSLGSYGVESILTSIDIVNEPIDGAFLSGPPFLSELRNELIAGWEPGSTPATPIYEQGRTVRFVNEGSRPPVSDESWGPTRILYVQNATDPVTFFSPDLLLNRPDWLLPDQRSPDLPERFDWVPLVTTWQVLLDLPAAGSVPAGFGHLFTTEANAQAWDRCHSTRGMDRRG